MKRTWSFILLLPAMWLLFSCSEPIDNTAHKNLVHQAIDIMATQGLYAQGNNWTIVKRDALEAEPASVSEAQEIIRKAVRVAGGRHSSLIDEGQPLPDAINNQQAMPTVTPTDDGVWQITLPTFHGTSEQATAYARAVLDALPEQVPGVIIDLRETQGENPYPMLAAVHRFLPTGTVLHVRSRQGREAITIERILASVERVQAGAPIECPVALLTSTSTRGAGEAVLLSFAGAKTALQVGSRTAGYAAVNQAFPLDNGAHLWLTTGNYVTTKGFEAGEEPIEPDLKSSTPLQAAKDWIKKLIPNDQYYKQYVTTAIDIMDQYGLLAEGPAWESAYMQALQATPHSLDEAHTIIRQALAVAGGKHSQLWTPEQRETIINTYYTKRPSVTTTTGGIIMIDLPGFMGSNDDRLEYAQTVLNALPDQTRVPGVIIDLRSNNGGSMYPMLAAVHRFLPAGTLLTFSTRQGDNVVTAAYVLQIVGVTAAAGIACPVAILTSETTASAGEATLLAFRGLSNTRTFGTPTAGYASGNSSFTLADGSQMLLTTARDVARTGEVFCDAPIAPDVNTANPLEEAIEWIQQITQ